MPERSPASYVMPSAPTCTRVSPAFGPLRMRMPTSHGPRDGARQPGRLLVDARRHAGQAVRRVHLRVAPRGVPRDEVRLGRVDDVPDDVTHLPSAGARGGLPDVVGVDQVEELVRLVPD